MGFKEIGKKIQSARESSRMTQAELAEKLGITQAAMSNYELGKRRLYLHQIQEIAEVLGRGINFFISQENGFGGTPGYFRPECDSCDQRMKKILGRIKDLDEKGMARLESFIDGLGPGEKGNV